jgi:hypothetical protein
MARNKYFLYMSLMFLAVVLVGFARSFYFQPYFAFPELPAHLYLHGTALTAWFVLALIQPWLIKIRRTEVHRRLGIIGVALAISVVASGLWTIVLRDIPEIDEFPTRAAGNLASLLMFSTCFTLGVLFRRKPATHKRLMLFASIPLLAPALDRLARIPVLNDFWGRALYWFPAPPEIAFATVAFVTLLFTVVVNDLVTERRVQPGTYWGLFSILIISPSVTFVFFASGIWVAFIHWVAMI